MPAATQLRHVLRRLVRAPMFTAITLITLAVGIGANTAIFTVVRGILLKPLPYPDADRLVGVWETAPGLNIPDLNASPATYFTFREESRTFSHIGIYRHDGLSITGLGKPEQVPVLAASYGVLNALGVNPVVGRWFSQA